MTDEKDLLKEREHARREAQRTYTLFIETRTVTESLRKTWAYWRDKYEAADCELAEIDGRLNKVSTMPVRERKVEPPTLTMDQIKMLADKAGIKLDFEGED